MGHPRILQPLFGGHSQANASSTVSVRNPDRPLREPIFACLRAFLRRHLHAKHNSSYTLPSRSSSSSSSSPVLLQLSFFFFLLLLVLLLLLLLLSPLLGPILPLHRPPGDPIHLSHTTDVPARPQESHRTTSRGGLNCIIGRPT
ncbi:hypothetical protein BO70DRAFT_20513 [Aspergillus heteromorphus CBS 117.55]|uniref:Uncharacterized protein n=1 Tax=Aspergillus heteromorphus CBS 117.55 TaxID=1448321 RepID=A0A317X2L6_9EURO|nr:uncharacterized protein BO70DRAFT_20513 [Aspergillus heteromorphus CBS 117.55]PWY92859.1 hypothetical protein BO70DRAFT_20513 [Aspergillus heteromorphus CBS 117.55]